MPERHLIAINMKKGGNSFSIKAWFDVKDRNIKKLFSACHLLYHMFDMFNLSSRKERSEEPHGTMNFQLGIGYNSQSTFATVQ